MNSALCIDASLAIKWVIPEEYSTEATTLLRDCTQSRLRLIAPPHFKVEVVNALWRKVVSQAITFKEAKAVSKEFLSIEVKLLGPSTLYVAALQLAQQHNLPTVYDAHYVALAQLASCEFWTDDRRLLKAIKGKLDWVRWVAEYHLG